MICRFPAPFTACESSLWFTRINCRGIGLIKWLFERMPTRRLPLSNMGKTYSDEPATTLRAELKDVSGDKLVNCGSIIASVLAAPRANNTVEAVSYRLDQEIGLPHFSPLPGPLPRFPFRQ